MTIADKLRHLADMSEQDPSDLHRIRWRLLVVIDDIDAAEKVKSGAFIDNLINNLEAA